MDKKILKDVIYYLSDEQGFVASVIEKDFHLTRILNRINEDLSTDIVFKGGTLLNKVYLNYRTKQGRPNKGTVLCLTISYRYYKLQ